MKNRTTTTRRRFLKSSAGTAVGLLGVPGILSARSPNEKLNIAGIGAGGQAYNDLRGAQAGVENRAARPPARTSRSPGSTPNGCCSARPRSTTTANCCGILPEASSRTTRTPTSG